MKFVLIKPWLRSRYKEPFLKDFDRPRQPLGLATLAAVLEKEGHNVTILDAFIEKIKSEDIPDRVYEPDMFVVATAGYDRWQCPNPIYKDAVDTANALKKKYPNVKICFIGPHGTMRPEEVLAHKSVDYLIRGEPELSFQELLRNLNDPSVIEKGVCSKKDGKLVIKPVGEFVPSLDELPIPAYHLLKMELYNHPSLTEKNFTIMVMSRNCPFNCTFCFRNMYGDGYRTRSPEKVIEEIKLLKDKFDVKNIYFQDLEFCLDKAHTKKICDLIVQEGLQDIKWGCTTRVTSVNEDLLVSMKQAGCQFIAYGLETADPEVLKALRKGITLEAVRNTINLTRKVGIKTIVTSMVGLPKDSKEAQDRAFKVTREINPDVIGVGTVNVPYPGTPIYQQGRELGIIPDDKWESIYHGVGIIGNEFNKESVAKTWRQLRFQLRLWRYKKEYGTLFMVHPKFLKQIARKVLN
ncbi:MAG: radical SAM protein [Nanoarchaeota archaeon]